MPKPSMRLIMDRLMKRINQLIWFGHDLVCLLFQEDLARKNSVNESEMKELLNWLLKSIDFGISEDGRLPIKNVVMKVIFSELKIILENGIVVNINKNLIFFKPGFCNIRCICNPSKKKKIIRVN